MLVVAAVLGAAADLGIAAVRGYVFRTDVLLLFAASAATTALLSAGALALVGLGPFRTLIERTPRASVMAAALWPLAFKHLYLTREIGAAAPVVVGAAIIGTLAVLEARGRLAPPGRTTLWVAVPLAVVAILVPVTPRLPGASLLRPPTRRVQASEAQPNLLLIVLDTVGAGHLGVYAYPRPVSPWLDVFASHSTVFEQAVSSSSWTLPAHASLFTGLFPRSHGADLAELEGGVVDREAEHLAGFSVARPLAGEATTLAEIAREAGLETGAICANNSFLHRFFQLDQGFDTYVDVLPNNSAAEPAGLWIAGRIFRPLRWLANANARPYLLASEVNDLALRWLRGRRDRRFFLFLNYMDAHDPFLPVGSYRRLFPEAWPPRIVDHDAVRSRRREALREERQALVDGYDAEIRYLDDRLAELFSQLESWNLLENTMVVVVGDHGESFGEHNEIGHGNGVYETEVRIPLIVRRPGQKEGQRIEHTVHLVDLMLTLLEQMALPQPAGLQGDSLWSAERTYPAVAYTGVFPHLARLYPRYFDRSHAAIYRAPWKLIVRSDDQMELYDLQRDPDELRDLAPQRSDVVAELGSMLDRFEDSVEPRFDVGTEERDPELLERLRALGYIE